MKKHIKTGIKIFSIIALLTAGFFSIQYVIKIKNTVVVAIQRTQLLSQFLVETFPEQVSAFEESLKAK